MEAQVARCLAEGAEVIARSPLDPDLEKGNFLPAIVLGDVKPDSPAMREEVFGPVVALVPFKDDEEALSDRQRFDDGPDRKRLVQGPQGRARPRRRGSARARS